MGNKELYYKERDMLREELHDLKNCQVTFLTFSITATALLLGLIEKLSPTDSQALFYLIPLIILLPSWCIFFEKATTISRIVGYNRVLERLILNDKLSVENFAGWENTLAEVRNRGNDYEIKTKRKVVNLWGELGVKNQLSFISKIFGIRPSYHRYWALIYNIFCWLSGLCLAWSLILGLDYLKMHPLILLAYIIPIAVTTYISWGNMKIAYELIDGKHSYKANEHLLKNIIGVE